LSFRAFWPCTSTFIIIHPIYVRINLQFLPAQRIKLESHNE